ncbi:MAG: SDR family NAD(P)-dependent oxidoreductase, partial [Gemmatimonadetes bacterium]|nr:SDR family NAD(P)-dependent oxidoreductase [Gemmatimonadota bacterium]
SYGLGARFAHVIAEAGGNVVLAARSVDKLESVAKEVEGFGVSALVAECDVSRPDDVKTTVSRAWEAFGRVD